ncbi:MAG TPA: WYL domain-containing protein [Planctomicrobium sp.]|nr:WYL domain-containing protein [Planctomicrobium sp.]
MAVKRSRKSAIPPGRKTPIPKRPDRDRRVRQNERIARVLNVLNLIQSRGRWDLRAIAEELGCSERTVRRDLEVLEFAGVPHYRDERTGCVRVRPDFRFPTLMLTQEELIGQAMATAVSQAPGLNVGGTAVSTTRKLAAVSNEEVQRMLSDASRLVEVFDLKLVDHSQHQEAVKATQLALLQGKQIIGNYDSPYESRPLRLTIHPYRLCLIKQAWYIIGRISGEPIPKTFRIARFKSLRMLDQRADVPDRFDLREFFGNAWGVFRGEQSYQVELWFTPESAKIVTETIWHHTQKVTRHKNGGVTLQFQVDGLEEIAHWILAWTGQCRVEQPVELRTRILAALRQGITMNGEAE